MLSLASAVSHLEDMCAKLGSKAQADVGPPGTTVLSCLPNVSSLS